METIGERVKSLRKKHRLTQEELGEKVDRSYGSIASIERNATQPDDVLQALSKYFKVPEQWLRTGEGEAPKGLIIPIRKELAENPWKDVTFQRMSDEIDFLRSVIKQLTAGKERKGKFS